MTTTNRESSFNSLSHFGSNFWRHKASGQDLGGSILFGQRIGFSGTPSDLMPRELGQCDYEPGTWGEAGDGDEGNVGFQWVSQKKILFWDNPGQV